MMKLGVIVHTPVISASWQEDCQMFKTSLGYTGQGQCEMQGETLFQKKKVGIQLGG